MAQLAVLAEAVAALGEQGGFLVDDLDHPAELDQAPTQAGGVLLNLHPQLSPHLAQFSRVIEIVNQEPALLAQCRDSFRQYRQLGHDPQRVEL